MSLDLATSQSAPATAEKNDKFLPRLTLRALQEQHEFMLHIMNTPLATNVPTIPITFVFPDGSRGYM